MSWQNYPELAPCPLLCQLKFHKLFGSKFPRAPPPTFVSPPPPPRRVLSFESADVRFIFMLVLKKPIVVLTWRCPDALPEVFCPFLFRRTLPGPGPDYSGQNIEPGAPPPSVHWMQGGCRGPGTPKRWTLPVELWEIAIVMWMCTSEAIVEYVPCKNIGKASCRRHRMTPTMFEESLPKARDKEVTLPRTMVF